MPAHGEPAQLDAILSLVQEHGGRMTTARRAIVGALVRAEGHMTAEQVATVVQRRFPDVHLTTIYRFLDFLEELGVVDHVHLGHGRAVYHLADDAHHHLVCERCSAVVEVPDQVFDGLGLTLLRDYGFAVRPHHFAVVGRCWACREAVSPGT